ncbi:MAG: repeat protein [Phycisphaerales bacterium]|nr:repeat protein [Phycisphaerales bacterium]
MTRWSRAACLSGMLLLSTVSAGARVIISLDYSLDTGGLFDSAAARTAMERAAQVYSDRLVDNLTAITPGGANTWSARIINPGNGAVDYDPGLNGVAANVIKVYVGSRALSGLEVGNGGAGAAMVGGTQSFTDNAASRGQPGALATPKTDVGPWGGSIAFDIKTSWYFGLTPGGLTTSKIDFLTVATHELAHLLGFSASPPSSSWAALVSNGKFTGAKATAAHGGLAPDVSGSHWLGMSSTVGPSGPAQTALMDANLPTGVRRRITLLDWAAMGDIGWEVAIPGDANANGEVDFGDFQMFEQNFGQANARWSQGDFNEDGVVDTTDFTILMKNYGRRQDGTLAPPAAPVDVPEPTVWGVLALGVVIRLMRRGRVVRR